MRSRHDAIDDLQAAFTGLESLVGQFSDRAEQHCGLTGPQLLALRHIGLGAAKVSDVARATRAHLSTASRVVDQLVDAGLVTRVVDPADRRAVVLTHTPAGKAAVEELQSTGAKLIGEALGDWTVAEVAALTSSLHRFRDAMAETFETADAV